MKVTIRKPPFKTCRLDAVLNGEYFEWDDKLYLSSNGIFIDMETGDFVPLTLEDQQTNVILVGNISIKYSYELEENFDD